MTTCAQCKTTTSTDWIYHDGEWFCDSCRMKPIADYETYDPLNPKSYMKNDKAWETDIQNRKRLPDGTMGRFKRARDGRVIRYG